VLFAGVLLLPLLFWDPRSIRSTAAAALFPWKRADLGFAFFAAYTMLIHCPLEEIFWRGAVTKPEASTSLAIAGNAVFFYLVHVGALAYTLGAPGGLLAVPAGLAGGAWAFMTRRSRSIWPALISHWAVDAVILGGMWAYFIRT
jgi:membrane protease YdiL (CAAX protease family)